MSPDHGEAVAYVEPACDVVLARQGREGRKVRFRSSPYRHALAASASQAALRQRPSRISSSVTARMLVPRMSTI